MTMRWTLGRKMAALMLAVLIPSLGLSSAFALSAVHDKAESMAQSLIHEQVEDVLGESARYLSGLRHQLAALSECPAVRSQNGPAIREEFSSVLSQSPFLLDLSASLPDGTVLASGRLGLWPDVSVSEQGQFQEARRSGRFALGEVAAGRFTGRPVVVASQPYRDTAGNFGGVVSAVLDLGYLQNRLAGLGLPEGSMVVLSTDRQQVVAQHPPTAQPGDQVPSWSLWEQVYVQESGVWQGLFPDGVERSAGFGTAPDFGWKVCVAIPTAITHEPVQEAVARAGLLFLVLGSLATLGTVLISRHLAEPILALSRASGELAAGRPPLPLLVSSNDEVAQLTRDFNTMVREVTAAAEAKAALIDSQRHTLSKLEALEALTDAALSTLDLDDLLQSLLERSMEMVSAEGGAILLLEERAQVLRIRASQGIPENVLANYHRKLGEGISGRAIAERRPIFIPDLEVEPDLPAHLSRARGVRSVVAVPLAGRARAIGVLRLDSREPGHFTEDHLQLMSVATERMALAIENAALVREAKERASHQELIHRVASAIGASLDLDAVVNTAVQELGRAVEASRCLVSLGQPGQPGNGRSWEYCSQGVPSVVHKAPPAFASQYWRRVMESEEPVAVADIRAAVAAQGARGAEEGRDVAAVLSARILHAGEPIGLLVVQQCGRPRAWTERETELVKAVATQLAVALENARLYGETDEKLQARLRELRSLLGLGRALSERLSVDVVIERAVQEGTRALDCPLCSLLTCQPGSRVLVVRGIHDQEGEPQGWKAGDSLDPDHLPLLLLSLDRREPAAARLGDPSLPQEVGECLNQLRAGVGLAVPMVAGDQAIGLMLFARRPGGRSFSGEEVALAEAVAGQVAVAMENARLFQLKSHIISIVSHEFRTPLTSIIGFSELLMMRELDEEEARRCLAHVLEEGLRLETLVNDFLDVSRLESGKVELRCEALELAVEIAHSLESLSPQRNGRPVFLELESGLPPVRADKYRLGQVLANLLSNALKYSPPESPVTIRARRASPADLEDSEESVDPASSWVVLTVEDRGVGIEPDQIPLLFTPFHRIDNRETRGIRGTGLGLAIVKDLVKLHGGRVWVQSVAGEGSRFHVALPSYE